MSSTAIGDSTTEPHDRKPVDRALLERLYSKMFQVGVSSRSSGHDTSSANFVVRSTVVMAKKRWGLGRQPRCDQETWLQALIVATHTT